MSNLVGDRRRDWGHQRDGLRHIAGGDEPGELRSGLATARNRRADTCRQSGSRDDRDDGAQRHKAQKDAAESRRRADAGGHAGSLAGHHTHDRLLSVAIQEASTAAEDNHAENEERPPVACRTPGGDEVTKRGNRKSARSRIGRAWLVSAARNPMNAAKPPAKPQARRSIASPALGRGSTPRSGRTWKPRRG